jgi:hypothetical protein
MKTLLLNKVQMLINKNGEQTTDSNTFAFGRKISLMTKLFGCRHGNMGRPFTSGDTAYRTCLNCGARRQFNPETLETHGSFYFPPVIKTETVNKFN